MRQGNGGFCRRLLRAAFTAGLTAAGLAAAGAVFAGALAAVAAVNLAAILGVGQGGGI